MDVYEVVKKLIGPINPVGETHTDDKRHENLVDMCGLVDKLLVDIDNVNYENKDAVEYSRKRAAKTAQCLFDNLGISE